MTCIAVLIGLVTRLEPDCREGGLKSNYYYYFAANKIMKNI